MGSVPWFVWALLGLIVLIAVVAALGGIAFSFDVGS